MCSLGIMFHESRTPRTQSFGKHWHLNEKKRSSPIVFLRRITEDAGEKWGEGFYQKSQENSFKKEDVVNDRYYMKHCSKQRQEVCYLCQYIDDSWLIENTFSHVVGRKDRLLCVEKAHGCAYCLKLYQLENI